MVQKLFDNVALQCWEHTSDRRFGVKPPYLCLKGGPEAADTVLALLDELLRLKPPAQRTMLLAASQRPRSCTKIRFLLSPVTDLLTEMSLSRDGELAVFEFTPVGWKRFRDAVVLWRKGVEDFSVHPSETSDGVKDSRSGEVWFWTPFTDP
jgi:hypothetical protein